jgi:Uma2 family endonuclease
MATEIYQVQDQEEELEDEYMPTFEHGVIEANIGAELRSFLKGKNLGRVTSSSAEFRFVENSEDFRKPGRQPDISFVRQEKLPRRFRSYPDVVPDLAVEIVSPSDKPYETEARIQEYQQAGVELVWIVNPFSRTIDVYRLKTGVKLQRYVEGEELNGEELLPGFKLAVSDVFDYPADPDPVPDPKSGRNRRA